MWDVERNWNSCISVSSSLYTRVSSHRRWYFTYRPTLSAV